jgi:hypothetical protein
MGGRLTVSCGSGANLASLLLGATLQEEEDEPLLQVGTAAWFPESFVNIDDACVFGSLMQAQGAMPLGVSICVECS